MTVWNVIVFCLGWFSSAAIAWSLWQVLYYEGVVDKFGNNLDNGIIFDSVVEGYVKSHGKVREWLMFLVWPYGIIAETIFCNKIVKDITNK